jgi:hypothetical protein
MMNAKERRFTPRHKLQIPLTFENLSGSDRTPQTTQSTDVSIRGVYFATDQSLEIGTPVKVLLRMPEQITGRDSPRWSCMGRVVRVDHSGGPNGQRGIGVELHYYDVMSA